MARYELFLVPDRNPEVCPKPPAVSRPLSLMVNFILHPHSSVEWYLLVLALRTQRFFDKLCLEPLPDYSQVSEENTPGIIFQKECSRWEKMVLLCGLAFPWLFPVSKKKKNLESPQGVYNLSLGYPSPSEGEFGVG